MLANKHQAGASVCRMITAFVVCSADDINVFHALEVTWYLYDVSIKNQNIFDIGIYILRLLIEIWKYIECRGIRVSTVLVYKRCISVDSFILPMQILKQEVSIRYENDPHYFCYNHKIVFLLLFLFDQAHLTSSIAAQIYFSLLGIHSLRKWRRRSFFYMRTRQFPFDMAAYCDRITQ